MKKLLILLAIVLLPTLGAAAPPTDESLMRLFVATQAESMIDNVQSAMEPMIARSTAQLAAGRSLTDEQKSILATAPQRMAAVMRAELNWEKMRPMMMEVYRTSFDQTEVDGLIAFYTSPVGQSYVSKMPQVLRQTMIETQEIMEQVSPKIMAALNQLYVDAKLRPPR